MHDIATADKREEQVKSSIAIKPLKIYLQPKFDTEGKDAITIDDPFDIDLSDASSLDLTLPGHMYMGPGTKILDKLRNNILPTDRADLTSLKHDVAYTLAGDSMDVIQADVNFMLEATDSETVLAGLALLIKDFGGFTDTDYRDDISVETKQKILNKMEELVWKFEKTQQGKP